MIYFIEYPRLLRINNWGNLPFLVPSIVVVSRISLNFRGGSLTFPLRLLGQGNPNRDFAERSNDISNDNLNQSNWM